MKEHFWDEQSREFGTQLRSFEKFLRPKQQVPKMFILHKSS